MLKSAKYKRAYPFEGPELGNSYCAATLFRQEGIKQFRVTMAQNGDVIVSSMDQAASDGSVIPELVLYKLAQ